MASILKTQSIDPGESNHSAVAFNLLDVQERAAKYLEEVKDTARNIIQSAEAEADEIRFQAREEGYARARLEMQQRVAEEARQLSDMRCRSAVASCESAVTKLCEDTSLWLSQWRDQTVSLAALIAEKLVRRELQQHNELLSAWIEEAMQAMADSRHVRLFVHPDDFTIAGTLLEHLAKSVPQAAETEIISDPEIELGGCIVRSSHGQIDQQLSSQLQRLVAQLS